MSWGDTYQHIPPLVYVADDAEGWLIDFAVAILPILWLMPCIQHVHPARLSG
jgi:hypothetical protein